MVFQWSLRNCEKIGFALLTVPNYPRYVLAVCLILLVTSFVVGVANETEAQQHLWAMVLFSAGFIGLIYLRRFTRQSLKSAIDVYLIFSLIFYSMSLIVIAVSPESSRFFNNIGYVEPHSLVLAVLLTLGFSAFLVASSLNVKLLVQKERFHFSPSAGPRKWRL